MFFIGRWNVDRSFQQYVENVEIARIARLTGLLEAGYARQGNWDFLRKSPEQWLKLLGESFPGRHHGPPGPMGQGGFPGHGQRPGPPPVPVNPAASADQADIRLNNSEGRFGGPEEPTPFILLNERKQPFLSETGAPSSPIPPDLILNPLHYQGKVVGYLGMFPHPRPPDELQRRFLHEQGAGFSLVAGMLILLAASFSFPLARRLIRPLKTLAAATDQLAAGHFSIRVPVTSADELGQLARGFNAMAQTLEQNEQARRQWVADISHELRTPLAILRGEVEAIQDGIRIANSDAIDSLHGEVLRLERLVDDLYQLSLSDLGALTYRKEELEPGPLLSSLLASYQPQFTSRRITMRSTLPQDNDAVLFGDPERIRQLFTNLFDNSLKYTDPGGTIIVRLTCDSTCATFVCEDSPPGVPESAIDRLFERLFRVEASRNRAGGGAGLGLAICRNIVEAHSGSIEASHSSLGGLRITVTLPLTGGNA